MQIEWEWIYKSFKILAKIWAPLGVLFSFHIYTTINLNLWTSSRGLYSEHIRDQCSDEIVSKQLVRPFRIAHSPHGSNFIYESMTSPATSSDVTIPPSTWHKARGAKWKHVTPRQLVGNKALALSYGQRNAIYKQKTELGIRTPIPQSRTAEGNPLATFAFQLTFRELRFPPQPRLSTLLLLAPHFSR